MKIISLKKKPQYNKFKFAFSKLFEDKTIQVNRYAPNF